jgi:NifU-like protein involved in Fe-S cluster formation
MTVSELLERGMRRNRDAPLAIEGKDFSDAEGNSVRFSVDVADGKLKAVNFRATSCATLIAYAEYIAEILPGQRVELAGALTPRDLIDALPGVPPLKRERAILTVAAFRAALANISITIERESCNEGRVHFLDAAP